MSNLNDCPLVWQLCGETKTQTIEKIQERALRFINKDYCGRPWPAAYITFMQITHQIQVLEPLCLAQGIFIRCRTTSRVPNNVG